LAEERQDSRMTDRPCFALRRNQSQSRSAVVEIPIQVSPVDGLVMSDEIPQLMKSSNSIAKFSEV
jgi:hypothetical protein